MSDPTLSFTEPIPAADIEAVASLHGRGLYLQAYARALQVAPLHRWQNEAAIILAGRLAMMLGNSRLGDGLHYLAWRRYGHSSECFYYNVRRLLYRSGPYAAAREIERHRSLTERSDRLGAHWLALRAQIAAQFRDFTEAHSLIEQAVAINPSDAWVICEDAHILQMEDRYTDALERAQQALVHRPLYRAAVQFVAFLKQLLGDDDGAMSLLVHADAAVEAEVIASQLYAMQFEKRMYAQALATLSRVEQLTPLRDRNFERWLAGRYADVYHHLGDRPQELVYAEKADTPFYKRTAAALRMAPATAKSVLLPVQFVRQHHTTCGPATLSALTQYFGRPTAHAQIVESIWYGGTRDHHEREWAVSQGWHVREFTVTWDAAVALIDRKVPFTLTTVEPGNAHLQAVIGYDAARRVLIIRDPYQPQHFELIAEGLIDRYAACGPRGMVMVPAEQQAKIADVMLPDEELYTAYFNLQDHLVHHRRQDAIGALEHMTAVDAGHRLTLWARRAVAHYDGDDEEALQVTETLLLSFPGDVNYQISKYHLLRSLGRYVEAQRFLAQVSEPCQAHPLLTTRYAELLLDDARQYGTVRQLLRGALRRDPRQAFAYNLLAAVAWRERDYPLALVLYRIAASLEDKDESYALDYFRAALWVRQGEQVLAWLLDRVTRFGAKSHQPAVTYFRACDLLNRAHHGLEVLESSLRLRPDDGELLLFMANAYAGNGHMARAAQLLEAARERVSNVRWLIESASFAARGHDLQAALRLWEQVLEATPHNSHAVQQKAALLAKLKGPRTALEYVGALIDATPNWLDLYQVWMEWADHADPKTQEALLRRLLSLHPSNAWAQRQLAQVLIQLGDAAGAAAIAQDAVRADPNNPRAYETLGDIERRSDHREHAQQAYRRAIELSADSSYSIEKLVATGANSEERRTLLRFIKNELLRQITHGEGVAGYYSSARAVLDPVALGAELEEAWRARPDLWQTWSVWAEHLAELGDFDAARQRIDEALDRFPLVPRLWLDKAHIFELQGDGEREQEALTHALQLAPHWSLTLRRLADSWERSGRYDRSRDLLHAAVLHDPLDPALRGYLARVLWRLGEQDDAVAHIEEALRLSCDYPWAWDQLAQWSQVRGEKDRCLHLAQELVKSRPGDSQAWLSLARHLDGGPQFNHAILSAIALDPRRTEPYELKIERFVQAKRFDEALQAARAQDWPGGAPVELRIWVPWVLRAKGEGENALRELEALLVQEPRYYPGWRLIADWYEQEKNLEKVLYASQQMLGLAEHDPQAHVYVADAAAALGDKTTAMHHYERALTRRPRYLYAAYRWFDLCIEDQAYDAAAQVLEKVAAHIDDSGRPYFCVRELRLAAARGQIDEAFRLLNLIARAPQDDAWLFDTAFAAVADIRDSNRRLRGWLALSLNDLDSLNPLAISAWAAIRAKDSGWRLHRNELSAVLPVARLGERLLDTYLDFLADSKAHIRFAVLRLWHRKQLHKHTAYWGKVGYVLSVWQRYSEVIKWMANWDRRKDVRPWMLSNLALSLRESGRWAESFRVGQAALALEPDQTSNIWRIWVALESQLRGDAKNARELYTQIERQELTPYHTWALTLLEATLLLEQQPAIAPKQVIEKVKKSIADLEKQYPSIGTDAVLRRLRLRVARWLGRRLGRWPACIYYTMRMS